VSTTWHEGLRVDAITLQLRLDRLAFETGLDVNAIIAERDALKAEVEQLLADDLSCPCCACPECGR
jgi:hypothetical protein